MTDLPMGVLFSVDELDDISRFCDKKQISLYNFIRSALLDEVCK